MEHTGVGLFARYVERIDRWVQFGMVSGRVIKVDFLIDQPADATSNHPLLDRIVAVLDGGEKDSFTDIEIALTGPTDYRPIYATIRSIPFGESQTVRDISAKSPNIEPDESGDQRVHQAIRDNPVPLLVPDHRVDDAPGRLDPPIRSVLRSIEGLD